MFRLARPEIPITRGSALSAIALLLAFARPAAAETRSYAIEWFHLATLKYAGKCPRGINPTSGYLLESILEHNFGLSRQEVRSRFGQKISDTPRAIVQMRGRYNGALANAWALPTTAPDPHINTVAGQFAPGFDLDGAKSTHSFIDPDTRQDGIDNQLFRALGCFQMYDVVSPARPGYEESVWVEVRNQAPAWLVTVSGQDLSQDGPVTVTFGRARSHVTLNVQGGALPYQSYVMDDDPRSHGIAHGELRNGSLTAGPFELSLLGDMVHVQHFQLARAQLRLTLTPDGRLEGLIGGYTPWLDYWYMFAQLASPVEATEGIDIVGSYYALRALADFDPDPKTGVNRSISSAFRVEAVPALVIEPSSGTASAAER